jgi:FAS-associated factor 2
VFTLCSLLQALELAKRELRFMLVYLHSEQHQDTDTFCSEVLADPALVEYVSGAMLVRASASPPALAPFLAIFGIAERWGERSSVFC